ncbi:MAG: AMP-binding protein [Pseudomonadota bacterium]
MLILLLLVALTLVFGLAVIALIDVRTIGNSWKQAFWLAPIKALYRLDNSDLADANKARGPVIYAISEQSLMDPAIFLASLPDDTLHVLDPASASSFPTSWFRELARTVVFDKEKMIGNRRLVRHLKGNGRLAVYFPAAVEPDDKAFRLYRAVTLLARKSGAKIIPIYTRNARFLPSSITPASKAPRQRFAPLTVHALPAMDIQQMLKARGRDFSSPANALFDRMAQVRFETTDFSVGLFQALVDTARTYGPGRTILEDTVTGSLTYKRMLIGARVLGRRFAAMSEPGEAMGVLLPNANGAVVSFFALQSAGRVAAMLNYTAGPTNVVSAVNTALIKTVLSSKAFIEKAELHDVVKALEENGTNIVWLDELRETITTREKISAALQWSRPISQIDADNPATILYTSGSEGAPKGVVLSHRNLHVNVAQSEARVDISVEDCLFNVLPIFHSFGLTGGTILPLFYGVKLFLYPSPLHYKLIPTVAAKVRPTIMFGTDTFLNGYARTAKDTDFDSLRFVVAGAEAVKPETVHTYEERFGCAILEGFGMTEASPVVAVNTATHTKANTVGRLLPGIDVRLEPVEGIEDGGRLWVRGPNVMLGYMMPDKPGILQPVGDGWHDSGDIVHIDKNGFMAIRGRAKRFAKIAGEMVSLGAVEMLVKAFWPEADHAAVSVPDRRKGERIILATTTPKPDKQSLVAFSKKKGVTELMVPQSFLHLDEIPVLGSGKTDYVTTKRLVEEHMSVETSGSRAA